MLQFLVADRKHMGAHLPGKAVPACQHGYLSHSSGEIYNSVLTRPSHTEKRCFVSSAPHTDHSIAVASGLGGCYFKLRYTLIEIYISTSMPRE